VDFIFAASRFPEQHLEGFDLLDRDKKRGKAEEDERMLEQFADQLGDIYGERPSVPYEKIPNYYA